MTDTSPLEEGLAGESSHSPKKSDMGSFNAGFTESLVTLFRLLVEDNSLLSTRCRPMA
jgi:hypothetical protein